MESRDLVPEARQFFLCEVILSKIDEKLKSKIKVWKAWILIISHIFFDFLQGFEIFLITVMFFSFSTPRDHSTSIRVGILEARSLIISTNASISPQGVPISGLADPIRLVLCMGRIVDAFASVYRCVNNFSKSGVFHLRIPGFIRIPPPYWLPKFSKVGGGGGFFF